MNQQLLQRFRERLLSMNRSVHEDVESIQEVTFQASGGQVAGEISNAPMHLGDRGTEEYLNQLSSTLLSNQEQLLTMIEEALLRMDAGTYGKCESCGADIGMDRLEALPFAQQCIACASGEPLTREVNINDGRPRTPDDTLAPEGEMSESRYFGQFDEQSDLPATGQATQASISDRHAAGTPGGGDALGGLAGSNLGRGEPQVADLEDAMGSGYQVEAQPPSERPRDRR